MDGEVGRFTFTTHGVQQGSTLRHRTSRWLFPALQAKEWYRTRGFKEVALVHGVVEDSYRKTSRWINRIRHQTEEEGTPYRTLCDGSEWEGTHILAHVEARTEQILAEHEVTCEGLPAEERDTASASTMLSSEAIQTAREACLRSEEETAAMADNPVPYEDPSTQTYVTIDDVCAKKQKAHRGSDPDRDREEKKEKKEKKKKKKKKASVYTTVAHVEHEDASYVLVGAKVVGVLRTIWALLLHNGLTEQGLIFLTDGQRTLQAAIVCAFSGWGSLQLILDWYHLEKRCKEVLSLAMKGREIRNATLEKLCPLLWHGLTDQAIQFLRELDAEQVKKEEAREELIGYLTRCQPYIPCYAVRQKLGLRNSSQIGEKMNDLVVSERQKNNGMSWSPEGSVGLAALTALIRNQEQDTWFNTGTVKLELRPAA